MKISFARNIDRHAGVPLCFRLSFFARVGRVFCGQNRQKSHETVSLGSIEIGAKILVYSVMRKMRSVWKDAEIHLRVFIVALLGPETPDVFGLLRERKNIICKGFSCSLLASNYKQSSRCDNQRMRTITVDEVYAEAMRGLS